ncbi:PLP-dependent cysteine synthase family protein [Massilia norwichensis]|uniref:Cysteine synthase family protein n=1 Tax=Massilia norwichensis TaxID=1442366 RepID=A0ABT2A4Z8_9BURK|nr:cysteine synthase family protein [Massilia norwichensis]MCS0589167.1 cysteine synthase family protein [Massilia norwichensis]
MQSQVKASVMEAIGETPVVRLGRLFRGANVVAKLEYMNPGGSIKDRMVRHMLRQRPADTTHVVESSSGNTGAALAMASAVLGLRCDVTVPRTTSTEKVRRIAAYGAEVHLCDPDDYHAAAERLVDEHGAHYLDQYCTPLNREAHYRDTGPELWRQLAGELDVFVCGVGSGGTISGIGRYLKEQNPRVRVIGVEPLHSSYRKLVTDAPADGSFSTVVEGVGKRQPSQSFDPSVVDDVVQVKDADALDWCRRLAREEGILAGGSSGCVAAGIAALLPKLQGQRIATVFPDSGAFYLSKYF